MKRWYMLDCHVFVPMPENNIEAIDYLNRVFHNPNVYGKYGMLCTHSASKQEDKFCHAGEVWNEFAERARAWFSATNPKGDTCQS